MGNAVHSPHPTGDREQEEMDILHEVVRCLREQMGDNLMGVVLFGSRARGEATEESDWDLLVVAEHLPTRMLARYRFVKSHLPPLWRGRISILAKTPSEFESALPPLYLDIALDGRILYDPTGYMQHRILQVRRLIQRLGLMREKRGKDIVWCWQKAPPTSWALRWDETQK